MMKNSPNCLVMLLLTALLMIGCSNNKDVIEKREKTISLTGNVSFNHEIDSLLHLFVREANCKDCYYEFYINKRDPDDIVISLRASLKYPDIDNKDLMKDYLSHKKSLTYTKVDGITFFIFTGIEDLIAFDSIDENLEFNRKRSSYHEFCWLVNITNGKLTIYRDTWSYPFSKLDFCGVIKFEAPNSDNDSIDLL